MHPNDTEPNSGHRETLFFDDAPWMPSCTAGPAAPPRRTSLPSGPMSVPRSRGLGRKAGSRMPCAEPTSSLRAAVP